MAAFEAGAAPILLISGAGGEAEVGGALAQELGLPHSALLLETEATSTRQNAAFSAAMVSGRVLVVTDDFHVWRCSWLYGAHFAEVEVVSVAGSRWWRPRLREGLSIAKAMLHSARSQASRRSTAE